MIKTLWPYLIVLIAFLAGLIIARNSTKEVRTLTKQHKEEHLKVIEEYRQTIKKLDIRVVELKKKIYSDSIKFANELKIGNDKYKTLKNRYDKVNYRNYNSPQLDSIVNWLYTN